MTALGQSLKASDLFIKALENEGVQYIFGVPGEENLDFVESLYSSTIKLVVTRHEQAAGFMAATLGRLTGKAGVALSTLGPGATNFTTAAAYAQLGGFPMMMITGQKPILKSKQGAFQIVNIVDMMTPMAKYTKQIVHGGLVPSYVREAVREAEEERPGAVHLELPEDVAHEQVEEEECVLYHVDKVRRPIPEYKAIARALDTIKAAKHPLLVIGAGANRKMTSKMLRQFVDQTGIPFCDTQMGKGVIDERHPRYMGTAAISDGDYVHTCLDHADVIIMVGHDVIEKPPFFMRVGDERLVIHISFYSAKVDQVYHPQLEVVGDIGNAIWQLKEGITDNPPQWDFRYFDYITSEMRKNLAWGTGECDVPMTPPQLLTLLRKAVPEEGIVCLDNGLYKVWFARQYPAYSPNTLLLDNALATMGAGLPSAMAAALHNKDKKVVAVTGDGGFMMNSQELITAVQLDLHVTVLILNDNAYGMIKWKQAGMRFHDFGLDLKNPDFVKYAESYGACGYRITKPEDFNPIIEHCLRTKAVHVVEISIDYSVSDHLQVPNLKKLLKETLISPEEFIKRQQGNSEHPPAGNGHSSSQQKQKEHTPQHSQTAPSNNPDTTSHRSMGGPKVLPFYLANEPQSPNQDLDVTDKYTGEVAYKVALAGSKEIDRAIAAAVEAFPAMVALASYQRKEVLEHCVNEFQKRFEELAMALCIEAGKPIKDSRGEVTRLIETFKIAAEECTRIYGEYADMDISKRTEGFHSITRMFPIGPVSMVSPFNFPLNLTAHKVAPALAVGVPFVLKPASRTPIGALIIGEVLSTAPHLPKGAFSILPCSRDGADLFTTDDRFKLLTFTGSAQVGWGMKARAGKKKVVLELGGNAGCVIEDFRSEKELDSIIGKVIHGAFYQSGQSCISVQRLFVKKEHYDTVKQKLVPAVKELKMGDPKDENTFIGPIISEKEAQRIESWVKEAVDGGAKLLAGGNRKGVLMEATLLEKVPTDAKVVRDEVFGPVLVMEPYDSFKQAIHSVNDSDYGLQAGVFTHDVDKAWYAFEHLDVGGVVLNHVPSVRVDAQPYGGVKDSGLGREGVRYSMKDMMEERVLMMVNVGKEDSF